MDQALLSFEKVGVQDSLSGAWLLRGASLALRSGELAWVVLPAAGEPPPLADLAEGSLVPGEGRVLFQGRDWVSIPPAEAAVLRGAVGRVFDDHGWISNLDVDENITLAQRHHTLRAEGEIEREAEALALRFGLEGLPRVRPALLNHSDLQRAQWVRAFLGQPSMILLEDPLRDVYAEHVAVLAGVVREALARGAVALWISKEKEIPDGLAFAGLRRFRLENGLLAAAG